MDQTEAAMVARALEIEPALLPYVPELLADFDALGSDVEQIIQLIRTLALPSGAHLIDLGSGKGALAIELAKRLPCEVLGIDLLEPFVQSSVLLAQESGVETRCRFLHGDIGKLAGTLPPVDVVIMAALGDVLGDVATTVKIIRRYLKPGGYMVIADGFIESEVVKRHPGFENYPDLEETRSALTSQGDELVLEWLDDDEEADEDEPDDEADRIRVRAESLKSRLPHLAEAFEAFVVSQQNENQFLEEHFEDAIWILRRGH